MTAAAFLPAPHRPPHDPLWTSLGGDKGWKGAPGAGIEITPDGCELRLAAAPAARRLSNPAAVSAG